MKHASSRAPDLLHGPVFSNMTRFFLPIMHKTAAVFLRLFMQVVGPNFQKLCV